MLAYSDPKLSEMRRPATETLHLPEEVLPLLTITAADDVPMHGEEEEVFPDAYANIVNFYD